MSVNRTNFRLCNACWVCSLCDRDTTDVRLMMKCVAVKLMVLVTWYVTIDAVLLSAVINTAASGASPTTRQRHISSRGHPTLTAGTSEAVDSGLNGSATVTSFNRPTANEVDGNSSTSETSGTAKDIWLIGLFPMRGSWPGGLGQLPAVEMGLEDVNADPNILSGYRLRMTKDDTEVSGRNNSSSSSSNHNYHYHHSLLKFCTPRIFPGYKIMMMMMMMTMTTIMMITITTML